MKNQDHIKGVFKDGAKSTVDLLFEGKIFKEGITRDDMNLIQNFIELEMESQLNSYITGQEFLKSVATFKMNSK